MPALAVAQTRDSPPYTSELLAQAIDLGIGLIDHLVVIDIQICVFFSQRLGEVLLIYAGNGALVS